MVDPTSPPNAKSADLAWSDFFADQLSQEENTLRKVRIASVHRTHVDVLGATGPLALSLPAQTNTSDFAVGDWALAHGDDPVVVRRLARKSVLRRKVATTNIPQLIAANIDTLFIVTSCNDEFNPARLERYLAYANEAGTTPVIVLTKADQADDPKAFASQAAALQRALEVVCVNAKDASAAAALSAWCARDQTVALVGSSGVGKSTLLNSLAAQASTGAQQTGSIRTDDAKGRHTTTARSLHAIAGGGWAIDTPGMRTLHLGDVSAGLEQLFAEITQAAHDCRFRDCTHAHEPGCAVQTAVQAGDIDPKRLTRWRKLNDENRENASDQTSARGKKPRGSKRR